MNIPYAFRKCSKCGEWLVANKFNFSKNKKGKYGLENQCKKCKKEYHKQWNENNKEYHKQHYENNKEYYKQHYENNKEYYKRYYKDYQKEYYKNNKNKIRKYQKEYRKNNKDKIDDYKKEYRKNNKDKIKDYQKEYYKNNKDEIRKYQKEYRKNNKDKIDDYQNKYYKNNPEKLFNKANKRRNKIENQGRGINKEQYKECNEWFDWKCAYSGEKMENNKTKNGRTLDHVLPLDNGGLNEPWNCVPMVKSYNSSKNKRVDVMNWYLEQEYFDIDRLNKIVEWQIYAYEKWGGEEFGELILITDLFEEE